jgi:hypothetical protein
MSSKQVLDEGKIADGLIEAARTHAAEIATRRAAQYAAVKLKGAPSAAVVEGQIRLDAALLEHTLTALRRADTALAVELGDDAAVFATRDGHAASVRASLVGFRDLVLTNCGDAAVAALGFVGETPRDPVALEALGATVCASVERSAPRSRRRGVRFDAAVALEGVEADVMALAAANATVRKEARESQAERSQRDEAWASFSRERVSAARSLDAQLRAVGLDDLADRLLPSVGVMDAPVATPDPTPAPTP